MHSGRLRKCEFGMADPIRQGIHGGGFSIDNKKPAPYRLARLAIPAAGWTWSEVPIMINTLADPEDNWAALSASSGIMSPKNTMSGRISERYKCRGHGKSWFLCPHTFDRKPCRVFYAVKSCHISMKFYHIRCPGFLMKSIYILGNDSIQHPPILYFSQHFMSDVKPLSAKGWICSIAIR